MPIDFYAHHGPFGANASFTLGRFNKPGGFGLELGRPGDQEVLVAYGREGEKTRALPFFAGAYPEKGKPQAYPSWSVFEPKEIERELAWATDTWCAGDLTLRLLTPFGPVPDPETGITAALKTAVLPVLLAEVTLDNSRSKKAAWAFFGLNHPA